MPLTAIIPNPATRAVAPRAPGVSPSPSGIEDTPTLRVPVRPTPQEVGPPVSRPAMTPPPTADLRFSSADWSSDGEFAAPASRRPPRVGDTLLGFSLVSELGRGAFARVFLAHQAALANRQVALKVTLRPTREAERLARLQHTNIVPVYSVHDDGPVQVICMPFLGRVTLADLIRAYRVDHPSRHSGRRSTSARAARSTSVDNRSKSNPRSDGKGSSPRLPNWTWASGGPPPIVGDPVAVLQLLAQLAAGLQHAHERGILHLDIKPANVLLADTGEPMLLDFNLSFDAANPARELVGGTMPYMAIEQLLDMRHRGTGAIDARTDLYALGALAFELLTGQSPFATPAAGIRDIESLVAARRAGPPSIRELNPAVTPAVEAIVRKLLAADPADRYQSAAQLREDVERHLADKPLKYAREASLRERLGKWRRRNPRLPVRLLIACLIGLALGLGGVAYHRAEANSRSAAVEQARLTRGSLDSARLDLILPDDPKARARGIEHATKTIAAYGLPGDANWRKRDAVSRLTEAERAELAGDLGELMILLAQAKWREAESRPESERHELAADAWKLLAAARGCFPAGDAPELLDRQAALVAPAVGERFEAATKGPGDTRDQFLTAADALARGQYFTAIPLLERVIAAQPNHAAAQFCLAYCRHGVAQTTRALERFDAAEALLPRDPRPAYQRGMIHSRKREAQLAETEFSRAIELDPAAPDAYRQRALARYRVGLTWKQDKEGAKSAAAKFKGAEADLTAALERGCPALQVHTLRAMVRAELNDAAGAAADREAAAKLTPTSEMDYLVAGFARINSDPKGALADYKKAEEVNPRSLIALQNQAHVLADRLKRPEEALPVATRVAELYPEFAPAIAGRAVLLARLGQRDEAIKQIDRARLISADPEITYQAACVYALTSKDKKDDRARAIDLLRKAFAEGYRDARGVATDTDLDPIRDLPEFRAIRQSAATLFR